ncbi:MAG: hypothetical protein R3Y64_00395 [Peptostreptococcaceae bacterium]
MEKSDVELIELYHSIFNTGKEVKIKVISLYDENGDRNKADLVLENEEIIVIEDIQVEEEIAITNDEVITKKLTINNNNKEINEVDKNLPILRRNLVARYEG